MSRMVRALLAVLLLLPIAGKATAQGTDPLAPALAAYRGLDFDLAAERLRGLLAADAPRTISAEDRLRALMYLGATEQFRERRPAAAEAFRTLLAIAPRYRPDELVFPPEVTALFREVRATVRATAVVAPDSASIAAPTDRITFRVHVTSPHEVRAMMLDPRGVPLRLLHDGPIEDSLDVAWSGRDAGGRLHDAGTYFLLVTSRGSDGAPERAVELPLLVDRITRDTLRAPALDESALRRETRVGERSWRPIAIGLAAAGAAVALPSAVGAQGGGLSVRYLVSAALGVAGVAGFTAGGRQLPVPENVEWNRNVREQHRAELERVRQENERRRGEAQLRILPGPAREAATP